MKKHFIARVVAGHRITIPKEVCEVLEIENGDLVDVDLLLARKNKTLERAGGRAERRSEITQKPLKIKQKEMRNKSR